MKELPNIFIFMTDHQRADTVLPEHPCRTPNVTRCAQEGVTFTQTYCPSPHCSPSRATFLTGLYPSRHGVWNNVCNPQALSRGLNPGVRLWSDALVELGYQLHWFGKWHVSSRKSPQDYGWQEHYVTGVAPSDADRQWEHYREVACQPAAPRKPGQILRPGYGTYILYGPRRTEVVYPDDTTVPMAVDCLRGLNTREPWCMYVGLSAPHDPYVPPSEFLDLYRELPPLPVSYGDTLKDKPVYSQRLREMIWNQLSKKEVREAIRHYWAYCTYCDAMFGRCLAALTAAGAADRTLVLYLADHGDYCGEHGLFAKGLSCFQGAYHVPAVMRWPAGITHPGRCVNAMVSLADFMPTLLEIVGCPPPVDLTGRSLMPFLRDEPPADWRTEIHTQCNGVELYYTQRSVMTPDFKYVFNPVDRDELYDRRRDPHELKNLVDDPSLALVKRGLVGRLWRFARQEKDGAIASYITVGLAPYGPAEAFKTLGTG